MNPSPVGAAYEVISAHALLSQLTRECSMETNIMKDRMQQDWSYCASESVLII